MRSRAPRWNRVELDDGTEVYTHDRPLSLDELADLEELTVEELHVELARRSLTYTPRPLVLVSAAAGWVLVGIVLVLLYLAGTAIAHVLLAALDWLAVR